METTPPPLVGFNNNVRYRGMRFHIQTEDSGVARPHIITHLFADGGHVIKSMRTDYSEWVNHPDRVAVIGKLMRDQHRAMALDLRDGHLDTKIEALGLSAAPPVHDPDAGPAETVRSVQPPSSPSSAPGSEPASSTRVADASGDAPSSGEAPPSSRRSSRAPENGKARGRSASANAGRPQTGVRKKGRPSASMLAAPSADSIFGTAPQESLDDVILSYVTHAKNGPPSRRSK